jgi:hypothetical protein
MSQAFPHGGQFADRPVQFIGLVREHLPVDARPPVWRKHQRDFIKGKARAARPNAISASRSKTLGSNRRRKPFLPTEAISPFSS